MYQPLEEYRHACPRVYVQFEGEHTHAIPLPMTTPSHIRAELFAIFDEMEEDMTDMTARRFLRHAITRAYVTRRFPDNPWATLADVHISLANRDHLSMYIRQFKAAKYPEGTGWAGTSSLTLFIVILNVFTRCQSRV